MKTAKAVPAEASSSRRSQPARQARNNPSRTSAPRSRTLAGREAIASAQVPSQPIDIFPGITHFTDTITALPKELVRHFTLLKEVDAKIFAPEEQLFQLIDAALKAPPPEPVLPPHDASSAVAPASAPMSAQNSTSGIMMNGNTGPALFADGPVNANLYHNSNLGRRQLFRQVALKIQEMLVSLEEKNHVISTANDALQKQLNRIEDIWPHLEGEFSDEAKWGSDTHWAYPENRAAQALQHQTERHRREGAASLSAAAQALADEVAARSDARKQAVAARKHQKNHHHESDHDDHDGKGKGESNKKSHSTGKRKNAATTNDSPANVGLGISTPTPSNGGTPATKRRKLEKPANGGVQAAGAMSTVFGNNNKDVKAKASASPRETPAPEPAKKRKALPTSNGQSKKSKSGPGATPSATSSPVIGAFPDSTKAPRASPAPSTTTRPASSKARGNSTQPASENGRQRPSSAASNKPNGNVPAPLELTVQNSGSRGPADIKPQKEAPASSKEEAPKPEAEPASTTTATVAVSTNKKEGSVKPTDQPELRKEPTPAAVPTTTTTVVTTKSGRASKPSTPALGSFPDPPAPRSRPARNAEGNTIPKRSHKKGASAAAAAAAQRALAQRLAADEENGSIQEDDADVDENEPTYCYCNSISYGEMVACDGDNCKREWFHLECVGLKVAPKPNVKWYCEDCKEQLKTGGKKVNGR